MLVKHILCDKGREVTTISAEVTILEAVLRLTQKRIGALVVQNEREEVVGILSERDVVTALAAHRSAALEHRVSAHMTSKIETCREADRVEDLMETMTNRRLRHLPVVEGGRLVGIVSIGDVVKSRIAETVQEAESLRGYIATG